MSLNALLIEILKERSVRCEELARAAERKGHTVDSAEWRSVALSYKKALEQHSEN
ncbi:MAG: hypothetical protein DDT26_00126 [Dehalococcoidia bacterium]|nr:hypothetical protein [Chloroflexota bacterium]